LNGSIILKHHIKVTFYSSMTLQIAEFNSMSDKTVLITGADGSIGSEISMGLAKLDARIIMAVINVDAANSLKGKHSADGHRKTSS
jgi:hypothetical protein